MSKSKKIDIRFSVSSDIYHLKVDDLSCWGISQDKPAVIEITMPGAKKPIKKYFPKTTTVYDSNSLFNNCDGDCDDLVELPDGIYNIKLFASPSKFSYEVNYAKLDRLQKELDLLFIKELDKDCLECDKRYLTEYVFDKMLIESLTRRGDRHRASKIYKDLYNRVKLKLKCKNC